MDVTTYQIEFEEAYYKTVAACENLLIYGIIATRKIDWTSTVV